MATLSVASTNRTDTDWSNLAIAADAALSDKFANDGNVLVYIENGSGGAITVTQAWGAGLGKVDGIAATARAISVGAGKRVVWGPFNPAIFNDANGYATLSYSAVTSLKVYPFRMGS